MAEDTTRAVGGGSTGYSLKINGKEYFPRPLSLIDLGELERECLRQYKRDWLLTFADNIDILPEAERSGYMNDKFTEAAQFAVEDLPPKKAYDTSTVPIEKKCRDYLIEKFDITKKQAKAADVEKFRRLLATGLDSGVIKPEDAKRVIGYVPKTVEIGYASWWLTAGTNGMLAMIHQCFKKDGLTKEDLAQAIGTDPATMATLSREIEAISVPQVGNG